MEYHKLNKLGQGGGKAGAVCAQLSCQDPQASLAGCIKNGDLTTFSALLADVAPLDDAKHLSLPDDEKELYPLPEDHWINQAIESENSFMLLQLSVQQPAVEFTQLLVRAGARADMYNDDLDQAVLHSAVLGGHGEQHIAALLVDPRNKADVNITLQPGGVTSIHLAAERGLQTCLKMLLDQPGADVNAKDLAGGRTPLFLAAKNKHAECVKMLIENGANPDTKCSRSSPREAIRENLPYFNIESIKVKERPRQNTVEYLVELLERKDLAMFKCVLNFISVKEVSQKRIKGFTILQKASQMGLHHFVIILLNFGVNPNIVTVENATRPILLAAQRGHYETLGCFVDHFQKHLEYQNSVISNFAVWSRDTKETVLHLVLKKSHKKALLGIASTSELNNQDMNYRKCLDILLDSGSDLKQQLTRIINKKDNLNNTALHYASQLWTQEDVTSLLNLGANIGVRNLRGEIPLTRILPKTLEDFLDNCATHESHPMNEDFKVEFNYSWLAPAVDDYDADEWDADRQKELEMEGLPETESLWCMAQSKSHRHLLRHPTVTSFLWLKWQRIRKFFSRNIRLYILFVTSLTWYIFTRFGGVSMNNTNPGINLMNCSDPGKSKADVFCHHLNLDSGSHYGFWYTAFLVECFFLLVLAFRDLRRDCGCSSGSAFMVSFLSSWFEIILAGMAAFLVAFSSGGLWYILVALLALLALRELLQMAASLKRYFLSLENLFELLMLSLLGFLLFAPDSPEDCQCEVKRHAAAVCILLAWIELIVLVAKHPRLARYNVYISMFYKVLQTFLSFLLWYSLFLMAFAFGFYIMLHKDIPGFVPPADHYVYFDGPWTSLVKTITMFVGELEFSDIPIDPASNLSWLSFSFLVVFVFFIVVILMNLLNGLAVSDTGIIMEKAEIVSYTTRVETISYMESVLLGDPFDFLSKWPPVSFLAKIPSLALCHQVYSHCPSARQAGHAVTGATGILLFYSLLPEKKKKFPSEDDEETCGSCRVKNVEDIPKDIMDATRILVLKKEEDKQKFDVEESQKQLQLALQTQQTQIDRIESQIQLLLQICSKK